MGQPVDPPVFSGKLDLRLSSDRNSHGGEDRRKMQKWMNKIESPRGGSEGKLSLTGTKVGVKVPFDQFPPNIKEMKTPPLSWERHWCRD